MALYFKEDDIHAFTFSILITLCCAFCSECLVSNQTTVVKTRFFLVVSLAWVVRLLWPLPSFEGHLTTLPTPSLKTCRDYNHRRNYHHDVEALPHGILFGGRSPMDGGLGRFHCGGASFLVGGSTKVFAANLLSNKIDTPQTLYGARWLARLYHLDSIM